MSEGNAARSAGDASTSARNAATSAVFSSSFLMSQKVIVNTDESVSSK